MTHAPRRVTSGLTSHEGQVAFGKNGGIWRGTQPEQNVRVPPPRLCELTHQGRMFPQHCGRATLVPSHQGPRAQGPHAGLRRFPGQPLPRWVLWVLGGSPRVWESHPHSVSSPAGPRPRCGPVCKFASYAAPVELWENGGKGRVAQPAAASRARALPLGSGPCRFCFAPARPESDWVILVDEAGRLACEQASEQRRTPGAVLGVPQVLSPSWSRSPSTPSDTVPGHGWGRPGGAAWPGGCAGCGTWRPVSSSAPAWPWLEKPRLSGLTLTLKWGP